MNPLDVPNSCPLLADMARVRNVLSTEYRVGAVVKEFVHDELEVDIWHYVVLRTPRMTHVYVWND